MTWRRSTRRSSSRKASRRPTRYRHSTLDTHEGRERYDQLSDRTLVLTCGVVATFQSKNNGLEYLKIALEKRVDEQTLLKPGDLSPGEIAARGLYPLDPRHFLPLFVFAHVVPHTHTIQAEP